MHSEVNATRSVKLEPSEPILQMQSKDKEPKKPKSKKIQRSRLGCKNCKRLKIKCDETKPSCSYCVKNNTKCDYSLKLTWGGRPYKDPLKRKEKFSTASFGQITFNNEPQPSKPKKKRDDSSFNNSPIEFVVENLSKSLSNKDVMTPSTLTNTENSKPVTKKRPLSTKSGDMPPKKKPFPLSPSNSNIGSPPAFLTPGGQSILGDIYAQTLNGVNSATTTPHNHVPEVPHPGVVPDNQFSQQTLMENFPGIFDGIESLSHAVNRISNGTHQLNLSNSDLFMNFVNSNFLPNGTPITSNSTPAPMNKDNTPEVVGEKSHLPENAFEAQANPKSFFDNELFHNYSEDIAKIESFMPENPSFLINESLSPNFVLFSPRKRFTEVDDDEEDIEPLDIDTYSVLSKDSASMDNLFKTIPPQLTPLPEILLQVPLYRSLLHFWVNVASSNLVPAPSHIYLDNPFRVLLPQMAMNNMSILTTLLAFSAKVRSALSDSENYIPNEIIDQLLGRSCAELLKSLKDKEEATSDATLATILLLSCYEAFNCENFERHRAHTIGARQIIMARRSENSSAIISGKPSDYVEDNKLTNKNFTSEGNIAFFLMRWFAYVDVIGALSSTKDSHKYLPSGYDNDNYERIETLGVPLDLAIDTPIDPKRDIDYLTGFDVRIFPQFAEIAILIRETNAYLESPGCDSNNLPLSILSKALEVKERITKAFEEGEARRQQKLDKIIDHKVQLKKQLRGTENTSPPNITHLIAQDNILRCTNKIFCDMGILNLYRRVLRIPRESSLVQNLANGIGETLGNNIESCSSAEICTIFCIFCAGCETQDPEMRALFSDRFSRLTGQGNVGAKKSLRIMERCWATGEDWVTSSRALDIDITLL